MGASDGGPAFPVDTKVIDRGEGLKPWTVEGSKGITVRDYFAARAMQQMIHEYFERNGPCFGEDHPHRNIPHHSYRMADAMIAVRETK